MLWLRSCKRICKLIIRPLGNDNCTFLQYLIPATANFLYDRLKTRLIMMDAANNTNATSVPSEVKGLMAPSKKLPFHLQV